MSVSAQLMMKDVNVCRACDSLKYLSHLSIVELCDFLGVIIKKRLMVHQLKSVHPESCSANPVWDRKRSMRALVKSRSGNTQVWHEWHMTAGAKRGRDIRRTFDAAYQKYVTAGAGATFPASPM